MNVEFLGSCANQTATREAVAFLVEEGDDLILIDAGPGIVRQVYRSGRKCCDVTSIVITHAHGDHTSGFAYLIWSMFYDRLGGGVGPDVVKVIGLPEVLRGVREFLEFAYQPSAFPFELRYVALPSDGRSELEIGDACKLRTAPVLHTVPNIGLRLEGEFASLSYSSDTLYCDEFVELAKSSHLMIHEGFVTAGDEELSLRTKHATAAEAGRAALSAGVGALALVHTFPPLTGRESELVAEAQEHFGGLVFVPSEFERISLPDLVRVSG